MDALEAIYTRRSSRRFLDKPLSEETIDTLVKAAMSAPSAGNCQPWDLVIIKNPDLLRALPNVHPYAKMCPDAQIAMMVCANPSKEKHAGFWVQDCAAATMNILLAARALELGAVWLGVYPREQRAEDLRKMFNVPEGCVPFSVIPIGYTDVPQRDTAKIELERVHYDNNPW